MKILIFQNKINIQETSVESLKNKNENENRYFLK
jgi:hypothetical protein